MTIPDLAQGAILATSSTIASNLITIPIPAVTGKRAACLGVDWLTDLGIGPVNGGCEFRGGAGGTTKVYEVFGNDEDGKEFVHALVFGNPGAASEIRIPATTTARLSVRYVYV